MPPTNILALLSLSGTDGLPSPLIALTGAGGKTSLLRVLTEELAHRGRSSLTTTTTHILPPTEPSRFPRSNGLFLMGNSPLSDVAEELADFFIRAPHGQLTLGLALESDSGKLRGIDPVQLCQLRNLLGALLKGSQGYNRGELTRAPLYKCRPAPTPDLLPCFLVEADGAARRPLKAHAAHEPQIPPCADVIIAVAGLDALGKTLTNAVHRPELAAERLNLSPNSLVTPVVMAALLLDPYGPFHTDLPLGSVRAVLLNKEDAVSPGTTTNRVQSAAQEVASALLQRDPGLTILAGSLRQSRIRLIAASLPKKNKVDPSLLAKRTYIPQNKEPL